METTQKELKRGDKGPGVKHIQEWLCLHGNHTTIDSDYGPATEHAVRQFQAAHNIAPIGITGKTTWAALVKPITNAMSPIVGISAKSDLIVAYAKQHLKNRPREIGGQNRGPWVRLYTGGHEGPAWPWCAGFASFIIKQAYKNNPPVHATLSCDALASEAIKKHIFIPMPPASKRNTIKPGFLFLIRKSPNNWTHAGIVTSVHTDAFTTIEGNTNDEGSREGYEACARTRSFNPSRPVDFIALA